MNIRDRRAIHQKAQQALSEATGNPGRIVLIYAIVCAALALLSSSVDILLSNRIADTGGLGNIGLRSVLSTVQTVLPFFQLAITSCLSLGYHFCVLRIARGQQAQPGTLLEGFRNFGPLFRALLFQTLMYFSLGIISMYLSSLLFMMTPFSADFSALMTPILESSGMLTSGELVLDDATLFAAAETLVPMLWIWLGLFLLLFLPVFYSYRMTVFCIADEPRRGALYCLHKSKLMMRRNRMALLKLDLSMWWYYLLQLVISIICYGEVILPLLGVDLGWDPMFGYYFFFVLSLALQTVSYYFLMNRVNVAYAVAYDTLQQPPEEAPAQEPDFPFPTEY